MDIELKATLQLSEYEALLKTLNCPPGTLARTLALKAIQDNERRLFRDATMYISKVRAVQRLDELVELFETHPDFEKLILPKPVAREIVCEERVIEKMSDDQVQVEPISPVDQTTAAEAVKVANTMEEIQEPQQAENDIATTAEIEINN